jgi:hypothetical protein
MYSILSISLDIHTYRIIFMHLYTLILHECSSGERSQMQSGVVMSIPRLNFGIKVCQCGCYFDVVSWISSPLSLHLAFFVVQDTLLDGFDVSFWNVGQRV